MTGFKDRQRNEETKYAMDAETTFRIAARRNRLFGQWAAEKMALTPEETDAYAKSVVQADFEEGSSGNVTNKVLGDLISAGVDIDEAGVRAAFEEKMVEARRQLMSES